MPRAFDLHLRVSSSYPFCCPLCQCPIDLGTLLGGLPQELPARYIPTASKHLEGFVRSFCQRQNISLALLRSRSRSREMVALRRAFCLEARAAHHSISSIARWLGVHHTSVLNLLGRTRGAK